MKRTRIYSLAMACMLGLSCNSNKQPHAIMSPIDSFTVHGIQEDELFYVKWTQNGNSFFTFSEPRQKKYSRSGSDYQPAGYKTIRIHDGDIIRCVQTDTNGAMILCGDKKIIYQTDTSGQIVKRSYLPKTLPGLDTNYTIYADFTSEMKVDHDYIVAGITFKTPITNVLHYFLTAPAEVVFRMVDKDTASFISQAMHKPAAVATSFPIYAIAKKITRGDKSFFLYGQLDTIYEKDMRGNTRAIALNNKDYTPPAPFNYSENDPGYFNTYQLHNFAYDGFIFSANTKHYILFYRLLPKKLNAQESAVSQDHILNAIILDEKFNILQYVTLPKCNYYAIYYSTTKGILIPREDKKKSNENNSISFDIYNL